MVDWNLIDHSRSSWSPLDAQGRSDMDEVRLNLIDIQSTGSVDKIYSDHFDLGQKISWYI